MAKRGPQPKFDLVKRIKWCNRCKKWLPFDDFGENRRAASGKAYYCKTCHSAYGRLFWNSVKAYEHRLARDFGLTPHDYILRWRLQDMACAVCGGELSLYNRLTAVDFDAARRRVRGLLCSDCKAGIGKLREDPVLLLRAAQYLTGAEPSAEAT